MKTRLFALALCCLLLFSGCTSMLERSYSSSKTHVEYSVTDDSSILRAESYQALLNSILYFVDQHVGSGTIRLYNYTGNPEADLARACNEVMQKDPLGAYAVHSINYESTRILTYYEVQFHVTYQRSIAEVAAIRAVSGQAGVWEELEQMVTSRLPYTTLRTAYYTGNAQAVADLFWLSYYSIPSAAIQPPSLSVTFYPESGAQRILELEIDWPVTKEELAEYSRTLMDAASLLTESAPPAEEAYTAEELARLLRGTANYDPSGSHTALAALQGEPVNDLGILLALEFLYQLNGIEASVATDITGTQMWLIVLTPSGYRHLLPRDIRPDPEATEEWYLVLYTDEELSSLGFDWPRELHPACVDYSGTLPE